MKSKKEVIKSLAINKKDVGSTAVQIGLLSEKINKLSEHFKNLKKTNILFKWSYKISKSEKKTIASLSKQK